MKEEPRDHTWFKVLSAHPKWVQMEKSSNRTILKTTWASIKEAILSLKSSKHIKITKVSIELLNRECLMTKGERLFDKKLEIILRRLIIITTLMKKMPISLILNGETLTIK